jgi:hypothetical protein
MGILSIVADQISKDFKAQGGLQYEYILSAMIKSWKKAYDSAKQQETGRSCP